MTAAAVASAPPPAPAATLAAPEPCATCRVLPPAGQKFVLCRGSFGRAKVLCPICKKRADHRETLWLFALMIGAVVVASVTAAMTRWRLWLGANLVLITLMQSVSIVPHELGHLLGAWLTRARVFAVRLGTGRTLFRFHVRDVEVRVCRVPVSGSVTVVPTSRQWLRLRQFIITAMGPVATASVAAVAVHFAANVPDPWAWIWRPAPWHALAAANVLLLVANVLIPVRTRGGLGRNDGYQLLQLLLGRGGKVDDLLLAGILLEADRIHRRGNFEAAEALVHAALQQYPDRPELLHMLGVVRIAQGRFEEAIEIMHGALDAGLPQDARLAKAHRGARLNNLAWAHLMIGTPEHLEEADRLAAEAYAHVGDSAAVRSTRGSVMVQIGDVEQGLRLLRSATEAAEYDDQKACCACFIAIGEYRRGNAAAAAEMVAQARRLDAKCDLLPRAERILGRRAAPVVVVAAAE